MTTHDERITSLEFNLAQFKTETLKAYTDLVYEVTILKGLGEDSIKRLSAMRREMEARFDRQDAMLQTLLDRLPPKE
jgi:uncharacterized coiled-coil protein SlyX